MDLKRCIDFMATSFTRHYSPGLLSIGLCEGYHVSTKVQDVTDLKQRISDAIATIDENMLQRTWQEIEYRLDVLRLTNGAHIEMHKMR